MRYIKDLILAFSLCLFVFFSCVKTVAQSDTRMLDKGENAILVGNTYRCNYFVHSDVSQQNKELVLEFNSTKGQRNIRYHYGTFINFVDSLHFRQYNTAPCGNDCFITTEGRYYLDADKIVLELDSTRYSGMCHGTTKVYDKDNKYVYTVVREGGDSIVKFVPVVHK